MCDICEPKVKRTQLLEMMHYQLKASFIKRFFTDCLTANAPTPTPASPKAASVLAVTFQHGGAGTNDIIKRLRHQGDLRCVYADYVRQC